MGQLAKQLGKSLAKQLARSLAGVEGGESPGGLSLLYGLRTLTAANNYSTQNPGGEPGVSTGFGVVEFVSIEKLGVARFLTGRGTQGVTTGWSFFLSVANLLSFVCASSTNAATYSPGYTLTASDVGKILCIIGWHDGSKVRLSVSRVQRLDGTAIAGFAPLSRHTTISGSAFDHNTHATDTTYYASATWRGTPTEAQIHAYADAARALSDMPATMDGATIVHRWSLRDALAGLTVVDGQVGPASMADTITNAAADAMGRVGSPTVVAIDTSVDGRKSYGVQGFSASSSLVAGVGLGIIGNTAGFHVRTRVRFDSIPAGSQAIVHCLNSSGATGYFLRANGSALSVGMNATSSAYTLVAGDLGRPMFVDFVFTGSVLRLFVNGVQIGSDIAATISVAAATAMQVGLWSTTWPFLAGSVFEVAGGDFVPTNAEILQAYVDSEKAGTLQPIVSKTPHLWRIGDDIIAAGGPELGVPATVLDRVGTDHLTRVGTGLTVAQRVERVYSYEATPIMYAADNLAWNAHFTRSPGFAGDAAGWWWNLVFRVASQNVPTRARTLLSCNPGGSGFSLYSYTTNSTLQAMFTNAAGGAATAPSIVIMPADVGKILSIYGVADVPNSKAKLYNKRLDQAGSVMAGYKPALGGHPLRLGDVSASDASEGIQIIGYQHGLGVPPFAQIAANYDAAMAGEDVVAMPGMSTSLYSLTRSIRENGGLMPATLLDRIGSEHLTTVGNPTVAPLHARAWGY